MSFNYMIAEFENLKTRKKYVYLNCVISFIIFFTIIIIILKGVFSSIACTQIFLGTPLVAARYVKYIRLF